MFAQSGSAGPHGYAAPQPRSASIERRGTCWRGSVMDAVSDNVDIETARDVAKVRFVADDRRMVRAELRSNRTSVDITFNDDPTSLAVGDLIFIEQEANQIDPAPAGLWVDDHWIGVVRLVTDELTVVTDSAGHLRRLLTREDPKVEEGNTVECDDGGVLKVLGERPVRTLDLREEDEIDLSAFTRAPAGQNTSFEDFGGLQDIVVRARELVEVPLERHEALKVIGARPIKGVLFTGPPGTGKRAIVKCCG
jgi:transitional endoplasmic reticulum ATPase